MTQQKAETMEHGELIARLEAASDGGAELDAAIAVAAQDIPVPRYGLREGFRQECRLGNDDRSVEVWTVGPDYEERYARYSAKPVTTSLDAIVALIEWKLPGWRWSAGNDWHDEQAWARVFPAPREQHLGTGNKYASTAPLALCIALLRALRTQDQGDARG